MSRPKRRPEIHVWLCIRYGQHRILTGPCTRTFFNKLRRSAIVRNRRKYNPKIARGIDRLSYEIAFSQKKKQDRSAETLLPVTISRR